MNEPYANISVSSFAEIAIFIFLYSAFCIFEFLFTKMQDSLYTAIYIWYNLSNLYSNL